MEPPVKVDEDLPSDVAAVLRTAGYDATTVVEQRMGGFDDERVWDAVQAEGRLLVTADKGFADASARPPGSHAGIVLFRLYPESRRGYVELAQRLVDTTRLDVLVGTIAVVTIDRLRIHRG